MAPITFPPERTGTPPMLGRASPCSTLEILLQKAGDESLRRTISLVGRRKAAAATALPREVSGVKNPAPSPRADKTRRPASSTTVTVIGVPCSRAFACAAFSAFSAISSVNAAISFHSFLSSFCALINGRSKNAENRVKTKNLPEYMLNLLRRIHRSQYFQTHDYLTATHKRELPCDSFF